MAQTGQAAKSIKKKTDAMPKASTGKLLKDAAVNAAMFVGPGKFVKAGKIVSEAVKVAEAAKKAKKYQLKASLVKKAIDKKNVAKVKEVVAKKETSAGDVLRTAKVEGKTQQKIARVQTKYETQAERGVTSTERKPFIGPEKPKKTDVTSQGKGKPVVARPARKPKPVEGPERKTTAIVRAKNPRTKVSDADAKDVSKELTARPSASRAREIIRPRSTSLTANEKAQIKIKQKVEISKKEPKSLQQIKDERKATQLARTNRQLKLRSKRKPLGPKTERQTKIIENAKKDTPRVPPHKVNVKIYRKKKWKPDTSNAGAQADEYTRPLTNSGKKGSIVRQPYKSKAEIREEGNNANTNPENWDVAGNRPKATISQGRGNVPQPKPIIPKEKTRTERREIRADRKRQQKARAGGPAMVQRTKIKMGKIKRDASGKPEKTRDGLTKISVERSYKVFPRAASPRKKAQIQTAKVMRNRVKVAEKEVMAAEKAKAKAEFKGAKKTSSRATTQISKRVIARAKLSKTRPLGK